MRKHTDGPWSVGPHGTDIWCHDKRGEIKAKVADIRGWGHLTGHGHGALALSADTATEIQLANARLISAAPDLLAAAEMAEKLIRNGGIVPVKGMSWHALTAAIAKAKGAK